jgi:hypothetical protein
MHATRFTRAVAASLAAVLLAGCGMLIGDPQLPSPECEAMEFQAEPVLSCEAAVDAAVESLTSSPAIQALSFQYGSLCPPNARCAGPTGNAGTVIITFVDATQVSVYVSADAGQLAVEPPQPYPPSGWEL